MAKLTTAEFIDAIKELSVLELNDLVKACEEEFGVSAAAGVVEGTLYDVNALNELAKIPSRDVLISKLLGSLQSPITNLARVLNQIAEQGGAEACEAAPAAEEAATEE